MDSSHDSWENEVLFVKIGARVLDLWLDTSSEPEWPKFSFLVPDSKVKTFFEILWFYWINLMIIEKMRSCLWKFEPGFLTCGLISSLPKGLCSKCSQLAFKPQTPNARVLGSVNFLNPVKLHNILLQISFYFWILGHFWQSYECLFPENCKKNPFKFPENCKKTP